MKISIFTPTNNTAYLNELYQSIKEQKFDEWVIVANGVDVNIEDSRIKIVRDDNTHKVGALKKLACDNCSGDILVEVDHDDILTPNAIEEIRKAFEDSEVGFVYSNSCNFKDDYIPTPKYNLAYGWKYRDYNYKGHVLWEHIGFKPYPASVSRIWWAPNHVRAWRTDVYKLVGGHNSEMNVLDDADLVMRTYLATKFKHIDKCLYLYRIRSDKGNTWLQRNKEIQTGVYPLYDKYIYKLVSRWATINKLAKIDLGGRFNCPEGYISVDRKNAKLNCDLENDWPFKNNSIGVIRAHDIIEHLKDPIHFMKEAYRVLVPGGYLMIMVPSTEGRGAFQDPTHISFWNENSFLYYIRREQAKFIDTPVRFQAMRLTTGCPSEWHKQNKIPYVYAHLVALKGQEICDRVGI